MAKQSKADSIRWTLHLPEVGTWAARKVATVEQAEQRIAELQSQITELRRTITQACHQAQSEADARWSKAEQDTAKMWEREDRK